MVYIGNMSLLYISYIVYFYFHVFQSNAVRASLVINEALSTRQASSLNV